MVNYNEIEEEFGGGFEETFAEFLEDVLDRKAIPHPFDKELVVALLISFNRAVVGGIGGLTGGFMPIFWPLSYGEIQEPHPSGQGVQIKNFFNKIFLIPETLDWQFLRCDSIYIFREDSSRDKSIVLEYENALKHYRAESSNIHLAGPGDMPKEPPPGAP